MSVGTVIGIRVGWGRGVGDSPRGRVLEIVRVGVAGKTKAVGRITTGEGVGEPLAPRWEGLNHQVIVGAMET